MSPLDIMESAGSATPWGAIAQGGLSLLGALLNSSGGKKRPVTSFDFTRFGASEGLYKLMPYLNNALSGGNTPMDNLLAQYFKSAQGNLMNAQRSTMGDLGGQGGAYAAMKGYDPYSYIQRGQSQALDKFAPMFGELATNSMKTRADSSMNYLNMLLSSYGDMIGLGGNTNWFTPNGVQNKG